MLRVNSVQIRKGTLYMADIGGINVNINVNITETITGLKAIQREAKKATQALRELETAQLAVSE